MKLNRCLIAICAGSLLATATASAQHPWRQGSCCPPPSCCPSVAPAPDQPKVEQPPLVEPTFAPEQAVAGSEGYAMNMIGDFIVIGRGSDISFSLLPFTSYSLKVAVNQNVRPQDRVYLNYNFYDEILTGSDSAGVVVGNDAFTTVFGIEKTFLDGFFSVGARLPIDSFDGEFTGTSFGDLSLILKALLLDTGTCAVCGGVGVSFPTGPDVFAGLDDGAATFNSGLLPSELHTVAIQPYVAGLHRSGNFFAQAWTALAIPFEDELPTIWLTDIGGGYFLIRHCDRALAGILELHGNIPLENASSTDTPIGIPEWLVLVEGVSAQFGQAVLTLGLGQPLTGPKPYQMEGIIQFNLFF